MAYFITLHDSSNQELLINVEAISYISQNSDGKCFIHVFGTTFSGVDGQAETIYPKESYSEIKSKLKDYE